MSFFVSPVYNIGLGAEILLLVSSKGNNFLLSGPVITPSQSYWTEAYQLGSIHKWRHPILT